MEQNRYIAFIKWYLSVPIKAIAVFVVGIIEVRTRVRAQMAKFDFRSLMTVATIITAIAWAAIYFMAEDDDRARLTDEVKETIQSFD